MKRFVFTIGLLLTCIISHALTVEQLLKELKHMPDIQFEEIKGKEMKKLIQDSTLSTAEKEVLSNAKKVVICGFMSNDAVNDVIAPRLNSLNGYNLAISFTLTDDNPVASLMPKFVPLLDSSIAVDVYSKDVPSEEYLTKPLFLINLWGMTGLVYIDGNIRPDTAKDFIQVTFSSSYSLSDSRENKEKRLSSLERFDIQRSLYPQEKFHVVTDRDIYCGGDTVWFRVFVVDADTHCQTSMSKYAYVELLNPFGNVQNRIKVIERDGLYSGYIPVDKDIFEGDYTLAAYTAFAENQGKDYFFRKPLRLLDQHSSKYVINSEFTPAGPGEVKGSFKLRSVNGDKMNYNIMSWTMPDGSYLEMPDSKTGFSRKFKRSKGEDVVLVKFGDYGRYVNVEYPVEKTDIAFYPEGGWLIADQPCTVAFKATDENGKGVAAAGVIRNDEGEEIAKFNTVHNGMGSFMFVPEAGRSYTAEYVGPEAELRTASIGSPKSGAAALRYKSTGSNCIFSVAGGEGRDLQLVVALRGMGVFAVPIDANTPLSFNKEGMPEGLYQALLVSDTDKAVLSERLFFIGSDGHNREISELSTDSTTIRLNAHDGIRGDCSLRIINGSILPGRNADDIRTQLLLQSELRGRIENPHYYFTSDDENRERNLDLLMMVNGWSRYNLPEALQGKYEEPQIPLEIGQEISGQVHSRWKGKPMEGVMVSAIAPKFNFGTFADTDENGEFHINGFDFAEGTSFIFRAMNEKGDNESNYDIFPQTYPSVEILREASSATAGFEPADFFNSIHWIMLDEIKVQAFKDIKGDIYESLASYSRNSEEFASKGVTSLENAIRAIPGMLLKNDYLMYRNGYVAYYIDGTIYEMAGGTTSTKTYASPKVTPPGKLPGTFQRSRFSSGSLASSNPYDQRAAISSALAATTENSSRDFAPTLKDIESIIPFQSIEKIDFIRPDIFILGKQYGGGVLMITSKAGEPSHWSKQFELKDYLPLGYQQYKEYASPILSVDTDEYDLQTTPTLLWLPSVKFDETGKSIDLKFPIRSDYRVVIEGISDNGDIISESF